MWCLNLENSLESREMKRKETVMERGILYERMLWGRGTKMR